MMWGYFSTAGTGKLFSLGRVSGNTVYTKLGFPRHMNILLSNVPLPWNIALTSKQNSTRRGPPKSSVSSYVSSIANSENLGLLNCRKGSSPIISLAYVDWSGRWGDNHICMCFKHSSDLFSGQNFCRP